MEPLQKLYNLKMISGQSTMLNFSTKWLRAYITKALSGHYHVRGNFVYSTLECLGICSHIIIQASKLLPDRHSFFISLKPPHKTVSSQTLSRWAADLLSAAGVDTKIFKAHSIRAAASNLHARSLSSIQICKLADWSTTSGVYQKFYLRYVEWAITIYCYHTEVPIYIHWFDSPLLL